MNKGWIDCKRDLHDRVGGIIDMVNGGIEQTGEVSSFQDNKMDPPL